MANLVVNNLPFFVQGDGSSTTAIIPIGFTPTSITFVQALVTSNGANVTSNVASAILVGTNVNVTFNTAFSYIVTLIFDVTPVLPLLSGSVQVSTPWLCDGGGTAGTPAAGVLTVQGISGGTAVPISGSVTLPAGQAVELLDSGGTNKASISAAGAVKVDGSAVTQPVSGTVTATQATGTNLHAVIDSGTLTAVTAITNALPTGANTIGKVDILGNAGGILDAVTGAAVPANAVQVGASDGANLQPLSINVKGTQGARGMAVQELKDAGRTYVTLVLDQIAAPASEALQTMTINKAGATSSATSYTVTAGKTLRIQHMSCTVTAPGAIADAKLRLRTATTVLVTSPILIALYGQGLKNTSVVVDPVIPDGLEIAAGQQVGMSAISPLTGGIVTSTLIGYEY